MKLVMYLGYEFIDAVTINTEKITEPGYVGSLKRELMEKHAVQLQFISGEPEFLIVHPHGKAN